MKHSFDLAWSYYRIFLSDYEKNAENSARIGRIRTDI
jgi:hypothetical protein